MNSLSTHVYKVKAGDAKKVASILRKAPDIVSMVRSIDTVKVVRVNR